jgi:hypothetical protein
VCRHANVIYAATEPSPTQDIDMMDDPVGLYGVGARVRKHRLIKRRSLIIRRSGAAGSIGSPDNTATPQHGVPHPGDTKRDKSANPYNFNLAPPMLLRMLAC